ncbi:40S ribosomal protein S4 [Cucumis melo]|uniref:40S ribosomal protein S4 n=1 Tax=Cucumis melo TaxID=3656 RepID=A0ABM3L998_CUCME|nr:40S ribosomal protein S4 [Cucumis melo]
MPRSGLIRPIQLVSWMLCPFPKQARISGFSTTRKVVSVFTQSGMKRLRFFKLCKVRSVQFGQKGIPYLNTYDGRTIRYPDPLIKANDTIKLDLESNKIADFIKFDVGNVVMVTGGRNRGRVGVIKNREKHKGSFETIHIQDATGHEFATRLGNVFTIGKGTKPWVSLPKGKGIKLTIIEEARKRLASQAAVTA